MVRGVVHTDYSMFNSIFIAIRSGTCKPKDSALLTVYLKYQKDRSTRKMLSRIVFLITKKIYFTAFPCVLKGSPPSPPITLLD